MDIEKMLIDGRFVDTSCLFQPCLNSEVCKNLPLYEGTGEITKRMPKKAGEAAVFNAKYEDINEYIQSKFDMDIYDFMKEYSSYFFGEPICSPGMLPLFTCVFRKEDDAEKLKEQMLGYQSSIPCYGHGTSLNLHDDSIFVFTLIECTDLSKLKCCGAYYVSQDYRFILKGSSQGDFTILYEHK